MHKSSFYKQALTVVLLPLALSCNSPESDVNLSDLPKDFDFNQPGTGTTKPNEISMDEIPSISQLAFGAPLTDTERETQSQQVLDAFEIERAVTGTQTERAQHYKARLSQLPYVSQVSISDQNNLTVQLRDGTPVFIFLKPDAQGNVGKLFQKTKNAIVRNTPSFIRQAIAQNQEPLELPSDKNAALFNIMNLGDGAQNMLQQGLSLKGYRISTSTGSLPDFRTRFNGSTSVGWISSHGGEVDVPITLGADPLKLKLMAVASGDEVSVPCNQRPDCADMRSDFNSLRIAKAAFETHPGVGYWVMTRSFFRKYFKFPTQSVLFIDACSTGAGFSGAEGIRSDLFNVSGLGHLFGWDMVVVAQGANIVAKYFFDRSLGTNLFQAPTPKVRPFPIKDVFDWLVAKGYDQDQYSPAKLKYFRNPKLSTGLLLAPSIKFSRIAEEKRELEIFGNFGKSKTGTVTIGNNTLNAFWSENKITASIADTDHGDVIVNIDDHESNKAPLTLWNGTIKQHQAYTEMYGAPGPFFTAKCQNIKFRADAHPWRETIDGEPRAGDSHDDMVEINNLTQNANCTWSLGGKGMQASIENSFISPLTGTFEWMHNEDVDYNKNWIFFLGHVDTKNKRIRFVLNYTAKIKTQHLETTSGYKYYSETGPTFNSSGTMNGATTLNTWYNLGADLSFPNKTGVWVPNPGILSDDGVMDYNIPTESPPTDQHES